MKRAIELIVVIKNFAAMAFTGFLMLRVVSGWFLGQSSLPFSSIWQYLLVSLACGVLYFVFLTDGVIKKMGTFKRYLLFALLFYLVVLAFAFGFHWFPFTLAWWGIFSLAFILVMGILAAVFEAYFRITGKRYSEVLAAYKSKRTEAE